MKPSQSAEICCGSLDLGEQCDMKCLEGGRDMYSPDLGTKYDMKSQELDGQCDINSAEKGKKSPDSGGKCDKSCSEPCKGATENDSDIQDIHAAPDGGWAWVICFACFACQALIGGLVYSFGLIYVELLDYFQRPKSETAWVLSIFQGVSYLGGPVYSAIASRLGLRLGSSIGSLAMGTGFIISMWAPNVYFLYFSIGVLGGLGFGLIYLISLMGVSQYFNKHRSLATGIGVAGVGVGTLVMGPLLKMLVDMYTWKGALLIEGAIALNCLVCSLLYRPLDDVQRSRQKQLKKARLKGETFETCNEGNEVAKNTLLCEKAIFKHVEKDTAVDIVANDIMHSNPDMRYKCDIVDTNGVFINGLERKDNFISHSFGSSGSVILKKGHVAEIIIGDIEGNNVCEKQAADDEISGLMRQKPPSKITVYKGLLRNVPYIFMWVSTFLCWLTFIVPYLYIVDTARSSGIDTSKSAWIISGMGITNTVGRVLYGALGSVRCVNRRHFYSWSLVVGGAVAILIPHSQNFILMFCLGTLYALISGGTLALSVVLVVDVVDPVHSSDALGLFCAACSLAYFLGPPFAGWLFDVTGTYLATYLFSGFSFISAGLIVLFVPCFK